MIKNNYILGLDLGITSVGWGIVDSNYKVIDYGVRLFDESSADNNLTRRTQRGSRRLKGRRQNRIKAIKYLLLNNKIIDTLDFKILPNVYELRCKGLEEKLTNIELANVLVNLAKRRGSSLDVVIDEDNKEAKNDNIGLTGNTRELKEKNLYVCQLQLERLKNGELRGSHNVFKTEDYECELKEILRNQGLSDELNKKIIDIVIRRRNFAEGPGSEKFPTPYGSYREKYDENGKIIIEHVNLIDVMRGTCSIYPDQKRIAKNTYKACLFNLLNDLNNLKINKTGVVSKEQKKEIIKYVDENGNITIKRLCKILNVEEEQITGFRIDKNGKNLLSEFSGYSKLLKILKKDHDVIIKDKEKVDNIIDILTKTLVLEERKKNIKKLNYDLNEEEIKLISELGKINGYHSLSKKAIDILIPELLNTNDNQMQILSRLDIKKQNDNNLSSKIEFDTSSILSPVTKRVHIQTLKVLNELREKYGEFDSIVIETTRSKNLKEEKEEITKIQKNNEKSKEEIEQLIRDLNYNPENYNLETKLKIRLYKEQEGKTIYAGLPIDLDTLLKDHSAYQIDHIIPYAVSFDNSLNNKALASSKENQDKGKRSPFAYFQSGKISDVENAQIKSWDVFKEYIKNLKGISKQKKEKLLDESDISKYDNAKEFVARNLIDTSYAIRSIMTTIKSYFEKKEIDTKVYTVKGKFTHAFRNKTKLTKDRNKYIHHAIDALIIAGSKNQKVFKQIYNLSFNKSNELINTKTGEVIDVEKDPLEDDDLLKFIKQLKNIEGKPKDFSYQEDKKTNRQFADQTIYSTRNYEGKDYIIKKYSDIYGSDGEKLKKLFQDGTYTKLLVYKNDKKTFDILKQIYDNYKDYKRKNKEGKEEVIKNPFAQYKEEQGFIRKYSKNGNGAIIKSLKYQDSELTTHIDITKKYSNTDKKVVLLSIKPYRIDIYQDKKGFYKALPIKYADIKQIKGKNVITKEHYEELKKFKSIDEQDNFIFSIYKNTFIRIINSNTNNDNIYMYTGCSDGKDKPNLEFKLIEKSTDERIRFQLSKNISLIEKYNVSPAGKWNKIFKEDLKLVW